MIDQDIVADLCGLADDHAHAVVDEEPSADLRAGVDLDAGDRPGELRQESRSQAATRFGPHPMGEPVRPDGVQPR